MIYTVGVDDADLDDYMDLSDAITQVGRMRDGRPIYQHMTQNGFKRSNEDQEVIDDLKRSKWHVTYWWQGQKNARLQFNGDRGWSDNRRLSDVQYVAGDQFYIVGRWNGRYKGVVVLEIPRARSSHFTGDATGHNDWFRLSGRRRD